MSKLPFITLIALLMFLAACGNDQRTTENTPETGIPVIDALSADISRSPDNPELYFARAQKYYEQDGFDEAIRDVQEAIRLDSTQPSYYHFLSDLHMDYFRSSQGLEIMKGAAKRFPEDIYTLLKLSEVQLILKQHEASMRTIDQVLKLDPQNGEAYFMFGQNFLEQADTARAINSLQAAVENDPQLIDGWVKLGQIMGQRNNRLAEQYFNSALSIEPDNVSVLHAKGNYLWEQNRPQEALETYRQSIIADPQYELGYYNSGLVYLELDSLEQALKSFDRAIKYSPAFVQAYYYRGLSLEYMGRTKDAIEDYKNALQMAPEYDKPLQGLTRLEQQ